MVTPEMVTGPEMCRTVAGPNALFCVCRCTSNKLISEPLAKFVKWPKTNSNACRSQKCNTHMHTCENYFSAVVCLNHIFKNMTGIDNVFKIEFIFISS